MKCSWTSPTGSKHDNKTKTSVFHKGLSSLLEQKKQLIIRRDDNFEVVMRKKMELQLSVQYSSKAPSRLLRFSHILNVYSLNITKPKSICHCKLYSSLLPEQTDNIKLPPILTPENFSQVNLFLLNYILCSIQNFSTSLIVSELWAYDTYIKFQQQQNLRAKKRAKSWEQLIPECLSFVSLQFQWVNYTHF